VKKNPKDQLTGKDPSQRRDLFSHSKREDASILAQDLSKFIEDETKKVAEEKLILQMISSMGFRRGEFRSLLKKHDRVIPGALQAAAHRNPPALEDILSIDGYKAIIDKPFNKNSPTNNKEWDGEKDDVGERTVGDLPLGKPPLETAVDAKNTEAVKLLLNHGACVTPPGRSNVLCRDTYYDIIKALLLAGADPNLPGFGEGGTSPLATHAQKLRAETCRLLLKHNADPSLKDGSGFNAIHHWATSNITLSEPNNALATLKVLLEGFTLSPHQTPADALDAVTSDGCKNTPLHIAAKFGNSKGCTHLLQLGANPNLSNTTGDTPLHIAAAENYSLVIQTTLEHGANPLIKNHKGKTPRDMATVKPLNSDADVLFRTWESKWRTKQIKAIINPRSRSLSTSKYTSTSNLKSSNPLEL
jgi:ankyrin repeat protein